jgi:DNA-binding beta-propeller fold protein YncE
MKITWVFVSLLAVLCACAPLEQASRQPKYGVVARYAVGGAGGWDYISVDERRHRIYMSRGDHVQVIDSRDGHLVGDLPNTPGVHGIASDGRHGFTSNGRNNTITVFDVDSLAPIDTIKVSGENPDAILYDPFSGRVLTFNGRSKNITAIDAASHRVAGTLAVSGKPEFAVTDGHGRVFVNIEDKNTIAVIDMRTFTVAAEWPLGACDSPTGLAYDGRQARLFSVCGNREMAVVDARSGKILAELPIGSRADGAAFDDDLGLAFSSNGDGTMTVVAARGASGYSVVASIATQVGARTIAVDSATHRLYLPTASFKPPASPDARPTMIPGSFVILVVAPL